MLKLTRVCVPLGLACNLQCRYCLRDMGKTRVPRLTDLMRKYVSQLDPYETEALIVTGGEPLLYADRMYELFELNPRIHPKIMTNGLLLTDEIVNYINRAEGELMLSHDGPAQRYLRGVEVLDDPVVLNAVRKADNLRINAVVTNLNTNCHEIYEYLKTRLRRDDFYMTFCAVYDTGCTQELIRDFNVVEFVRTMRELREYIPGHWSNYGSIPKTPEAVSLGVNVLPDGAVVSMSHLHHYGTVENSREEIMEAIKASGDWDKCNATACHPAIRRCCIKQLASDHWCKVYFHRFASANRILE